MPLSLFNLSVQLLNLSKSEVFISLHSVSQAVATAIQVVYDKIELKFPHLLSVQSTIHSIL